MKAYALTTFDNPYDPFDEFALWLLYDNEMGYGTASYLARIAKTSDQLSDAENALETERAINEILKYDFQGIYKKVSREISEESALPPKAS